VKLVVDDPTARKRFMASDMSLFDRGQFTNLGGLKALVGFRRRNEVFEAVRSSPTVRALRGQPSAPVDGP
jgi:hypothetical protein